MKLQLIETQEISRPKYELVVASSEGDCDRCKTLRWPFDEEAPLLAVLARITPQLDNAEGEFYTEEAEVHTLITSLVGLSDGGLVRVMDSIRVVEYDYEAGIRKVYFAE